MKKNLNLTVKYEAYIISSNQIQDEDLQQLNNDKKTRQQHNKIHESSEEDNELGDDTISGENDFEYAEFSLSVRTSLKEQVQNNNTCSTGIGSSTSLASASLNVIPTMTVNCATNLNEFDDFMSLPISTLANVSSKNFINTFSLRLSNIKHQLFNVRWLEIILIFDCHKFLIVLGNHDRYRTPITSASVFNTLLEGPKMSYSVLGSGNSNSSSSISDSSSTESLRNGLYQS